MTTVMDTRMTSIDDDNRRQGRRQLLVGSLREVRPRRQLGEADGLVPRPRAFSFQGEIWEREERHVTSHHVVPPKESKWRVLRGCALCLFDCYDLWVVCLLCLLYVSAVLCCFIIAAVAISMAQQLHFGEMGCITNFTISVMLDRNCILMDTPQQCVKYNASIPGAPSGSNPCIWYYNGQGFAFELLAGPLFDTVLAFGSLVMGFVADYYNRKDLLVVSALCWSAITALTGTVNSYWQLVVLRFSLAISQSGCTPFATSILADYFHDQLLATALGIYNWGLNLGYGLSFVLGNFLTWNRVWGEGWRWAFYLAGMPGFLVGVLAMFTLKEPVRSPVRNEQYVAAFIPMAEAEHTRLHHIRASLSYFCRKEILLTALAAGIRQGAFYVWLYNCDVYYESLGQRAEEIGTYMSWSPVLGGSLGLVLGGYISDSITEKYGTNARLLVVIISQTLSVPFCVATLLLPAPVTYFMDIPAQILGEMWVSVTLALIIEISPLQLRTSMIGLFLFVVDFMAGWGTAFVPILQNVFMYSKDMMDTVALRYALLILYPGGYALSVCFYCLALVFLVHANLRMQKLRDKAGDGENTSNSCQNMSPSSAIQRPPAYERSPRNQPPSYGSLNQQPSHPGYTNTNNQTNATSDDSNQLGRPNTPPPVYTSRRNSVETGHTDENTGLVTESNQ